VPALIFSRNTASDQDEENSKQENLTLLSAKQSHFFRDSKANITMLIVGNPSVPWTASTARAPDC
jgi:hypothetical protein